MQTGNRDFSKKNKAYHSQLLQGKKLVSSVRSSKTAGILVEQAPLQNAMSKSISEWKRPLEATWYQHLVKAGPTSKLDQVVQSNSGSFYCL